MSEWLCYALSFCFTGKRILFLLLLLLLLRQRIVWQLQIRYTYTYIHSLASSRHYALCSLACASSTFCIAYFSAPAIFASEQPHLDFFHSILFSAELEILSSSCWAHYAVEINSLALSFVYCLYWAQAREPARWRRSSSNCYFAFRIIFLPFPALSQPRPLPLPLPLLTHIYCIVLSQQPARRAQWIRPTLSAANMACLII